MSIVADSFNRSNTSLSTTGLGTADTGQTWVSVDGIAAGQISSNTAKLSGSSDFPYFGVDTGILNQDVSVDVNFASTGACGSIWAQGNSSSAASVNWDLVAGSAGLLFWNDGAGHSNAGQTTTGVTTGVHTLRMVVNNGTFTVYIDGVQAGTATPSGYSPAGTLTFAGIGVDVGHTHSPNPSTVSFDNFKADLITTTVALTSQSGTASRGTIAGAASLAATGQQAAASRGSLIAATSEALTGQHGTAAAGSISGAGPLTGISATSALGSLSPALSAAITGQSTTSGQGSVVAAIGAITQALTGVSGIGGLGSIAAANVAPLTSPTALGAFKGSVTPGVAAPLIGDGATSVVGTLTAFGGIIVPLSGFGAVSSRGSLTVHINTWSRVPDQSLTWTELPDHPLVWQHL